MSRYPLRGNQTADRWSKKINCHLVQSQDPLQLSESLLELVSPLVVHPELTPQSLPILVLLSVLLAVLEPCSAPAYIQLSSLGAGGALVVVLVELRPAVPLLLRGAGTIQPLTVRRPGAGAASPALRASRERVHGNLKLNIMPPPGRGATPNRR